VLTAAHCLLAPRTGRVVQPGSVHFLLGYHLGRWTATSRVASYATGPGWETGRGAPGADWAVLTLENPVGTPDRILPLAREAPAPRTPLMLGGYQQDRPEVILADTACRAIGLHAGTGGLRTFVHDCAGTRGASGAPVLVQQGGGWAVAGIVSLAATEMALGHAVPAAAVRLP
jgi:protease YdgD